jgi:TPP-dependent indolepyruvate ferredoxin oxidoreductase alpha subunit
LEHPDNIKTLGFCGAIAEVEEFILFAAFLQKKYNIPVYLSVHPRSVAIVDNFVNFIQDEDLGIFVAPKNWNAFLRNKNGDWAKLTPEIGFKTHKFAKAKVKEIRRRIEESELYRLNVEQRVNQIKQLGVIENGNAKPIQLPNAVAEHAINSGA